MNELEGKIPEDDKYYNFNIHFEDDHANNYKDEFVYNPDENEGDNEMNEDDNVNNFFFKNNRHPIEKFCKFQVFITLIFTG